MYHSINTLFFITIFLSAAPLFAFNYIPMNHNILISLDLGCSGYADGSISNSHSAIQRLAFGKQFLQYKKALFGMEIGIQDGSSAKLNLSDNTRIALGGLPYQAREKPISDILLTASIPTINSNLYVLLGAGMAHRSFQFDRCSTSDINQTNSEIRIGISYKLTPIIALHAKFSSIFGNSFEYHLNDAQDELLVSGIPTQYNVLFGATISLDKLT